MIKTTEGVMKTNGKYADDIERQQLLADNK